MNKSELRRVRKAARAAGRSLDGELSVRPADEKSDGPSCFSESARGRWARDQWARQYDERNGAPESDYDR